MYLVWRRDQLTHDYIGNRKVKRTKLSAILSENRRVDGKPKRRQVAYLGHIEEARIGRVADQAVFWYQAGLGLDGAELNAEDRARFEGELLARVPRPDVALLAHPEEWRDLLMQSRDAAVALLPSIPLDEQERARRAKTLLSLRQYERDRARMEAWIGRLAERQRAKHHRELREYFEQLGGVPEEPVFDYGALDPKTAEAVQASTQRIKDLAKG